jgi:protein-L-isoaspartate(D-aspartate) O-methyltransferase
MAASGDAADPPMSAPEQDRMAALRARMVEDQLARRGISDERVLAAMGAVPREAFVPPDRQAEAYEDCPLPIGERQTISQPFIVALMIEAAELKPGDRVLEVGSGCGYAAAVMGRIAGEVFGIERHAALGAAARDNLAALGIGNVTIVVGDGTKGLPDEAPFDAIIVSAGGPDVPPALKAQLAVGGRLVIPVGTVERQQTLRKVTRTSEAAFPEEDLGPVAFVPLIGEAGWGK